MLSEKELIAPVLSVVSGKSIAGRKNARRVKIIPMNQTAESNHPARSGHLTPPVDQFNSAYFKGRDRDPL